MSKLKYILITANFILLAGLFIFSVVKMENIRGKGKELYLKLAPVDPRSLMQGDYMTLSFDLDNQIGSVRRLREDYDFPYKYVVVSQDSCKYLRGQNEPTPCEANEVAIKLAPKDYWHFLPTKSYFFQEGTEQKYSNSEYARVKVDEYGIFVIVALCDENKKDIHESDIDYLNNCRNAARFVADYSGFKVVSCAKDGEPRSIEDISREILDLALGVI